MKNTRRSFLKFAGALASTLILPERAAWAAPHRVRFWQAPSTTNRTLVLINCEGGYDALSMLPPRGSTTPGSVVDRYLQLRPTLGFHPSGPTPSLALSGLTTHGLHPSLGLLQSLWSSGNLAILSKVGLPTPELSHFRARDIMSKGRALAQHADPRGWLGRLSDAGLSNTLDILGVGVERRLDFNAAGSGPVVFRQLSNLTTNVFLSTSDSLQRNDILRSMLQQSSSTDQRITAAGRIPSERGQLLSESVVSSTTPIVLQGSYPLQPTDGLTTALQDIARVIGANLGTKVFYTSAGGFDHHVAEEVTGTGSKPTLSERLSEVMHALSGFISDLQSPQINRWNNTTIVLFTEFGRRNAENHAAGTDHGHGFNAFVLGGSVVGGFKGNVLSLPDLNTMSGNLPREIDYRNLFRRCLAEWLMLPTATVNSVFDDYTPVPSEPTFTLF